jgi:hypothetical protein
MLDDLQSAAKRSASPETTARRLKRYYVRTISSQQRTIREPHQLVDSETNEIVDEYRSKRAALSHAAQLNREH